MNLKVNPIPANLSFIIIIFCYLIFSNQIIYGASDLKCEYLNLGFISDTSEFVISAIAYSPVVEFPDGGYRHLPHHLFLQNYKLNVSKPFFQVLLPYYDPITFLKFPFFHFIHEQGLRAVYQAYGMKLTEKLKETIITTEKSLARNRQMLVLIKKGQSEFDLISTDKIMGFLRIFDGSIYNEGPRKDSNYRTHLEVLLDLQGKQTTIVDSMRTKGYTVFEIGKFYINDHLKGPQLNAVRRELRKWLFDILNEYSIEDLEQMVFFAHTASSTSQRLYQMDYGFQAVDHSYSQGLDKNENILMISGFALFQNLKEKI
jgi:hypothetical protein